MQGLRRNASLLAALTALGALGLAAQSAAAAPAGNCTAAEARAAVGAFVAAFNRGDYTSLDAQFAPAAEFEWYSSDRPGTRLGAEAKRRDTLLRYFRARHDQGDRLGLASFDFNGNWGGYGNFGMKMRRSVPGFRDGEWFQLLAKGALLCEGDSTELIVITLGAPIPAPTR